MPRADVGAALLGSTEAVGIVIDELYDRFLDRAPDAAGRAYWVTQFQHGVSEFALAALLIGSAEYYAKP
jgi:hypothetical protein